MSRAGAVLLGATNMGEYAYDFTGRNAHDGNVANPHDPKRLAGGSSSGSAAAVAAGFAPVSLGSDTNGSVRVPSSLCGLFGIKPTYGRISRAGAYPFVGSFDHVGVFARGVEDLAMVYEAIAGPDPADPACATRTVDHVLPLLGKGKAGLRVGIAGGYFRERVGAEAMAAVEQAGAALGAQREVLFPEAHRARAAAFLITMSEGAQLHLDRLRTRAADFDPETRDRFLAGAMLPAAWVIAAQRFRRWYRAEVLKLFELVDVVIAPATPVPAPLIEQTMMEIAGEQLWVRGQLGLFTQPISFVGLPVVAAPMAKPGALPIGVQLIAAPWREDLALRAAAALEAERYAISAVPVS
jgi:aspartyl-tRNA(Asn)/glutamyl-tRNA(Gln) amidotransferase subunit A